MSSDNSAVIMAPRELIASENRSFVNNVCIFGENVLLAIMKKVWLWFILSDQFYKYNSWNWIWD